MPRYPGLDTLNASTDPTQILIYSNTLTDGAFGPLILGAFWLIILLGSIFMQIRFSGRERFEVSFAVASFSTWGMSVLMSLVEGLLNPIYVFIAMALAIVSVIWLYFSSQP